MHRPAAATELHDYAWIARHLPRDGSVTLDNVSSRLATLTLAGPRSRDLLQALTRADVSNKALRFFRCRQIHVGMAPVRALRLSFVGELGYELHHPMEYQRHLYDLLMAEGEQYGIVDWGYRALDSMRLEKGYRLWGEDMSADWTPLQAGMERFVDFDKGDFIGREALLREREEGPERHTGWSLTVARGTLRIALKAGGLGAVAATPAQPAGSGAADRSAWRRA